MEKYQDFVLEDFVMDDEFRKWVVSPSEFSTAQWNTYISENPGKKTIIEQAVLVVKSLEPSEDDIQKDWIDAIWTRVTKSKKSINNKYLFVSFTRYAAVFVLAFLMGIGVYVFFKGSDPNYSETYTEINVPYGQRSQLTLYDGTRVWLNSGSTLKFPIVFNSKNRQVFVKGEAFFDVAKNEKKPFIVNAGQLNIEVLGTRFNICAYADDKDLFATLEEGKIIAINNITGEKSQINPGEQAVLHPDTRKITLQRVNTELFTSWKENRLRFEDAPFSDIIKKMERWYDVKIIVDGEENFEKRYNMTIKTESLREMLRLLSLTTSMKYEIVEDRVFIHKQ